MINTKNKRIVNIGGTNYISIPHIYIQDGIIDPKKKYDLQLTESEQNEVQQ
jgi:hypothetical protein